MNKHTEITNSEQVTKLYGGNTKTDALAKEFFGMIDAAKAKIFSVTVASPIGKPKIEKLYDVKVFDKFLKFSDSLNETIDAAHSLLEDEKSKPQKDEHGIYLVQKMYMCLQAISHSNLIPILDYYHDKEAKKLEVVE